MTTANLMGGDALIVVFLVGTVIYLWGLVDSIVRPGWAYKAAGSNKALWVVLILVIGFIPAAIYLLTVRPRVARAQQSGWQPPSQSPGWHPDPSGRHEYRYWDGHTWTPSVADNGVQSTDPY